MFIKDNLKPILGILAFMGFTLAYLWGIQLFTPEPKPPTEGIPHNYYHPDVFKYRQYNCPLDSLFDLKLKKQDSVQLKKVYRRGDTIIVKATMYQAVIGQCDDSPDKTADQTLIPNVDSCSHLKWIAVSQDLLWFNNGPIRYGDTVYVIAGHKTGYYIVHDAMNKRWNNKIDFLESIGVEAYKYNKAELIINI